MPSRRSPNLLKLVLKLQGSRVGITLSQITEDFGCHYRTAQRMLADIETLLPAGQLIKTEEWHEETKWRIEEQTLTTLLDLEAKELAALETAIESLKKSNLLDMAANLEDLETKVRNITLAEENKKNNPSVEKNGARSRSKFARKEREAFEANEFHGFALEPGPSIAAEPEIWERLNDAIQQNFKIGIWYHAPYEREAKTIDPLCPFGILIGRFHYLIGFPDNNHSSLSTYRLDRITRLFVHKDRFRRPRNLTIQDVAARSFGPDLSEEPQEIVLRISRVASHEFKRFEFHPRQRVTEQSDKSLRVEFTASGLKELCWELMRWEGGVRIQKPKALKEEMARQLELSSKTVA